MNYGNNIHILFVLIKYIITVITLILFVKENRTTHHNSLNMIYKHHNPIKQHYINEHHNPIKHFK